MLKNYLKMAWVNLFRYKGFSLMNILGLTIGMTCTLLISLWVYDELTFDKDQKNYSTIYQVIANRHFNNQVFTDPNMPFPLSEAMAENYPQVKTGVVTSQQDENTFLLGNTLFKKTGINVSKNFFKMFPCKFIRGNETTALQDENSIILTESMASAFFGDQDPINKVLRMNNEQNVRVRAVIADPPNNSSFAYEFLQPYSSDFIKKLTPEWRNSFSVAYLDIVPGADVSSVEKNINSLISEHVPQDKFSKYFMFPMSKWHLESNFEEGVNTGGLIEYVKLFSIIAIIILLIACINFMNLSTARSEKKSKEVGIRKTLGSDKKQLIIQFLCESLLLSFLAFIFAVISVYLVLPYFNLMFNKELWLPLNKLTFWATALFIVVLTGLLAGSYPALYLSSFNPITVLKGTNLTGKKALLPRRILVTTQFIVSILLISATLIIYQQIKYIKNRPIGYDSGNLVMIPSSEDLNKNFSAVKDDLLKNGFVEAVTQSSSPITEIWWTSPAPDWKGKPKGTEFIVSGLLTDMDFTKTLNLKILQGNYFTDAPSDLSSMVLNKTAAAAMGLKNPIGMQMKLNNRDYTVIGVVDDIVIQSPFKPADPLMILYNRSDFNSITLRLNQSRPASACIENVKGIMAKYNPARIFEYQFVNDAHNKKFASEELIGKLINIFAGLAIFICCIGMAGLTAFTIERRSKELGIRKILGATFVQAINLISAEFLKLVFIAFIITVPLTWFLMNRWLQNYTFRITISPWIFFIVVTLIVLLTLAIVLINLLKIKYKNPIKNLRTE